jgi:hypothetical protein
MDDRRRFDRNFLGRSCFLIRRSGSCAGLDSCDACFLATSTASTTSPTTTPAALLMIFPGRAGIGGHQ